MASQLLKSTIVFYQAVFQHNQKKSGQKFKYIKNEKCFKDEIKSIFHYFHRAFNEANKTKFLGRLEADFNSLNVTIF